MSNYHKSVLLQEVVTYLNVTSQKRYIDATLGGGGHTLEMLERGGLVLGIDADQDAIREVERKLRNEDIKKLGEANKNNILISQYLNISLALGNYRNIDEIARIAGFESVAGVLFDLGVSSHQLDTPKRGFSFRYSGPLDMRMDQKGQMSASDLLNRLSQRELKELFETFGQERYAGKIAERIVRRRTESRITTTEELTRLIERAVPRKKFGAIHPATKIFQALRIAVNDEVRSLNEALPKAFSLLEKGGRLLVISFHSIEDRLVKLYFNEIEKEGMGKQLTKKPVTPSKDEVEQNPRSRSAKLRVIEKII
ncbi:MAG TPA: 16S rRNA (cytosine(1402)-N(4))-methyltransferase RsmH [Patescibacteria group bacterium]|nr:16S rRNA (cytosine(1402)-N(4))-methyltransferase RsmH [Patescibacteria group bacterium]